MKKNQSASDDPARKETRKRAAAERRKLKRFLEKIGANEEKWQVLDPLIENVAWMKVKLDDAREDIGEEGLTVEYDNGGGQSGVRENPAFRGYAVLWKSYSAGMASILSALPQEMTRVAEEMPEGKNMLELIRNRRVSGA